MTTPTIAIKVDTQFIPSQSDEPQHRFVFAYHIEIHNQSAQTVQLLRRYWSIHDGNGKHTEVEGDGVVGEQPLLPPNARYQYTSGCVLETPVGTMQGYYVMQTIGGEEFQAPIPLFRLAKAGVLN